MIELGSIWPPKGIDSFDPIEVPLLNTLLLLCSGATVTYAHHAITAGNKIEAVFGLILTIVLAAIFTALQGFELLVQILLFLMVFMVQLSLWPQVFMVSMSSLEQFSLRFVCFEQCVDTSPRISTLVLKLQRGIGIL